MAIKVARGYRTVSGMTAGILAGLPPLELQAKVYADMYAQKLLLQYRGVALTLRVRKILKLQVRRSLLEDWKTRLEDPRMAGQRTVSVVRPCLQKWVDRVRGGASFRMTQVLTGHGCFSEYLCRIGKERTT